MKKPTDGDLDKQFSEYAVDSAVQSFVTIKTFGIDKAFRETDIGSLVKTLSEKMEATNSNDLTSLEDMLTGQAYALNAIFNKMSQVAARNLEESLGGAEVCLKLGLRAQSQCRATIEAISTVKNPPVMGYVRQANITQGPQQINNGITEDAPSRAGEKQNPKNKLLEKQDGNQLDTGTQSKAIGDDQAMEAVGTVDRA